MNGELLAPAGDFEALRAAVSAGADAVYIGAAKFSARQNAKNFDFEELSKAISYCHIRGVKVYLAINTLVKSCELSDALEIAGKAYEYGVDAYIVQDIGLIGLLRKNFGVPVHASTQMTVFDEYGLMFLKELGTERAVLSRECTREEILALSEKNIMELEVFCHGAICMSYSGQCLMSSMIGGRSANRGLCAQPCRLPYSVDGKKGYYLSPKDLCLLDEVRLLSDKKIASLKIEGRMKGPAYVASAVSAYRKAMDNQRVGREDYDNLLKAFSRGQSFTKGCYGGEKGKAMMNTDSSNDNVFASADKSFTKSMEGYWKEGCEKKKIPISGKLLIGEVTRLYFSDGVNTAVSTADTESNVRGKKTDGNFAYAQLSRLGQTPYELTEFECEVSCDAYFSAAQLNALRRDAVEKLSTLREGRRSFSGRLDITEPEKKPKGEFYISASVKNVRQAEALIKAGARVYVPYYLGDIHGACAAVVPNVYKVLPKEIPYSYVVAGSIGAAYYARRLGKKVIADYGMNVFNEFSAQKFDGVVLSAELSLKECEKVASYTPVEVVAYGYLPVMTSANCVIRAAGKCGGADCTRCNRSMKMTDRKNAEWRVTANRGINEIYNSVPIFMADKTDEIKHAGITGVRLCFTDEEPEECVRIYKMYTGEEKVVLPQNYTRGHFYRSL